MALDEQKENDQVEDFNSFKILAGADLSKTLPEVSIDYIDDDHGKGFSVKTGGGGCGDGCSSC